MFAKVVFTLVAGNATDVESRDRGSRYSASSDRLLNVDGVPEADRGDRKMQSAGAALLFFAIPISND
jgi:hypothetical protein